MGVSIRHLLQHRRVGTESCDFENFVKLFSGSDERWFLTANSVTELLTEAMLPNGDGTHYALGWTSYRTSQGRWAVGHEGGGASWVVYYPDAELAVIALSNLSGARADSLPYDIARDLFAQGIVADPAHPDR